MDVMQWGRMLWVWAQHHIKILLIADVSSAALIVLQNVSTFYHFNTVLYPNTLQGTWTATASVSLWDSYRQMGTFIWILTQLHIATNLVWSYWAVQKTGADCVPSALASFMPLTSSAGLSANNELQRKWMGQFEELFCDWAKLRNTSIRIADLSDEIVSADSKIHNYRFKDVQSQNSRDHLMCYIPSIQDVFVERTEKARNLLSSRPTLISMSYLISCDNSLFTVASPELSNE
jgi:hypothetical protein